MNRYMVKKVNMVSNFNNHQYLDADKSCYLFENEKVLEQLEKDNNLTWNIKICSDKSLWHKACFEEYPSVIAHEYYRLYSLLEEGQTYGAFLQVKDTFEVLIKLPVLLSAAWIYNLNVKEDKMLSILDELLKKPVALGDWRRIGNMAERLLGEKGIDSNLQYILKDIVQLLTKPYSKREDIVTWRNDKIGHGALMSDKDKNFQGDIKQKIGFITKHLKKCEKYYKILEFYLYEGDNKFYLRGKDKAKELNFLSSRLYTKLGNNEVQLYPFIYFEDKNIYFFDYYKCINKEYSLLNYPLGYKKKNKEENIFKDIYERVYEILEKETKTEMATDSAEGDTHLKENEELVYKKVNDLVNPKYLVNWIKNFTNENDRGVMILQMESGMGKTTLIRALDNLALNKIKQKDTSVRAYYINDVYSYKVDNFLSDIGSVFSKTNKGQEIKGNLRSIYGNNCESKGLRVSRLLQFYKEQYEIYNLTEKLIFIIDGLDEIPACNEDSIFDFIPDKNMLPKDVYVLLTSRTDKELKNSPWNYEKLNRIKQNCEVLSIGADDTNNLEILKQYINQHIDNIGPEQINSILASGDSKFIYLSFLKELAYEKNFDITKIPSGKDIFPYFLDRLKYYYSDKFFNNIKEILVIIASQYEPLTIKEISYLNDEDKITFRLLSYLNEISLFLKVERSKRGNLFSISNQELRNFILEEYKDTLNESIEKWIDKITNISESEVDEENDGQSYLFTYIYDYVEDYFKIKDSRISSSKFIYSSKIMAWWLANGGIAPYTIGYRKSRGKKIVLRFISSKIKLMEKGEKADFNELGKLYRNLAFNCVNNNEIIEYFTRAIEFFGRIEDNPLKWETDCVYDCYMYRARAYHRQEDYGKAVEDFNVVIGIIGEQIKRGIESPYLMEDLLANYVHIGGSYLCLYELNSALINLNKSISLIEENKNSLDKETILLPYANLTDCYLKLKQEEKVFEIYDEVIGKLKEIESISSEYPFIYASLNSNRALACLAVEKYEEAAVYSSKVIEFMNRFRGTEYDLNLNDSVDAYTIRWIAYMISSKEDLAQKDYNELLILAKEVKEEGENFSKLNIDYLLSLKNIQKHHIERLLDDVSKV